MPKAIDFGVAKAMDQPLTKHTLVAGFGAIIGTLECMSPDWSRKLLPDHFLFFSHFFDFFVSYRVDRSFIFQRF
jgi:hypothetical protein